MNGRRHTEGGNKDSPLHICPSFSHLSIYAERKPLNRVSVDYVRKRTMVFGTVHDLVYPQAFGSCRHLGAPRFESDKGRGSFDYMTSLAQAKNAAASSSRHDIGPEQVLIAMQPVQCRARSLLQGLVCGSRGWALIARQY